MRTLANYAKKSFQPEAPKFDLQESLQSGQYTFDEGVYVFHLVCSGFQGASCSV